MSSTNADEEAQEHRVIPRPRTLLAGKLVFGNDVYTLDCKVRDISALGARVEVEDTSQIPNNVVFLDTRNIIAYEASVKWRTGKLLGLSFERALALDDKSNLRLQILRKLAIEARTRMGS